MKSKFNLSTLSQLGFGLLGGFLAVIFFGVRFNVKGSLVEWISALATLLAVLVSLWLARDKKNNDEIEIITFDDEVTFLERNPFGEEETDDLGKAHKIIYETKILFHNPSDYVKMLYDMKLQFIFEDSNTDLEIIEGKILDFRNIAEANGEFDYISLQPKESKIVEVKMGLDNEYFDTETFIKQIRILTKTQEKKEIIFELTVPE